MFWVEVWWYGFFWRKNLRTVIIKLHFSQKRLYSFLSSDAPFPQKWSSPSRNSFLILPAREDFWHAVYIRTICPINIDLTSYISKSNVIQGSSTCYLKTLEPLNSLHLFMDQFVHYIHGKVCRYRVFNIFTQYVSKILTLHFDLSGENAPHFI